MKKIALFDFDGTLSQGYISMAFLDWLFNLQIYPSDLYQQQMELVKSNKQGTVSYEGWCRLWGILWAKGLTGKTTASIAKVADDFFKEYKSNIYPSSYQLVKLLKDKGYLALMISTAASEVVILAGKELAMDEVYSTEVLTQNRVYLNKITTAFHLPTGKKEFMEQIISSKKYDLNTSIAFGDSTHDAGMLEKVKFPIALNASEELAQLAKANKWLILNHRNVVEQINQLI